MICAPPSRLRAALTGLLYAAAVTAAASCSRDEAAKPDPAVAGAAEEAPATGRVEWVKAPDDGDAAGVVHKELARAKTDRRTLVVYVGAAWCEPCEHFHRAAEAGELDGALPGLRFLAFDLDRDRERLTEAGYGSKMIPLFAIPREDGAASPLRMEGGIKGDGAAGEISARLTRLLARARQGRSP